ncbi:unnamed protein product, partial [Didymodactylos carnosus]
GGKTQHFNRDDQLQQNHPPPQRTKPSLRKQKHRFQTGTSSNFDSYTNISNYVPPNQKAPPLQNYRPQVRRRRLPTPPRVSSRAPSRNQQSIPPAIKRRTTTLNACQLHNIPALMTLNLTHLTPSHTCHEHTKDQRAHLPLPTSINRFDNLSDNDTGHTEPQSTADEQMNAGSSNYQHHRPRQSSKNQNA